MVLKSSFRIAFMKACSCSLAMSGIWIVCSCLPNKNRLFINVIVSLFVCFYLLAKGSNNRSTSSFLFSTGILFLPLAMTSAAKSLLRPAMYFCRFPFMKASIRKSCRVFSMMLISDTKKPSSVS